MTYQTLADVNATTDVSNLLVYANDLTGGILMPLILLSFFIIICIGSFFMQMRFSGRGRFEMSFAVAGFATFGLGVLMSSKNGLLNPTYLIISLGAAILGVAWLYFSSDS